VSSRGRLLVAAAGAAVLAIVAALVYASADVVEHGHLLPWAGDDVRKVRVLDSFDFYISSETGKPTADLVNSYLLLATATVCMTAAILLDVPGFRPLLAIAAVGTAYLAVDEQFAIHETIGHNLGFLADLPGIERPDDVVLAAYALPAALFVYFFWPRLRTSVRATRLLVAALVLFAISSVWDVADLPAQELLELAPSVALLAAFLLLAFEISRRPRAVG
jgi:hypothetical protein